MRHALWIVGVIGAIGVIGCHRTPTPAQVLAAIQAGDDAELARLLDRGADPNGAGALTTPGRGTFTYTALSAAIHQRDDRAIALLLAHHADPDRPDASFLSSPGDLPLASAAALNEAAAIRALIAAGAHVDGEPGNGRESPAARAADAGQLEALEALLAAGANVDGTGDEGTSYPPLAVAAEGAHAECVKRLLAAGAHVDRRDVLGMTALNHAVAKDSVELVDILLAANADPMLASRAGWTPAFTAQYHGNEQILDRLRKRGVTDFGMKEPPPLPASGMGTIRVPVVEVRGVGSSP